MRNMWLLQMRGIWLLLMKGVWLFFVMRGVWLLLMRWVWLFISIFCRTHQRRQKRWWSAYLLFYDRVNVDGSVIQNQSLPSQWCVYDWIWWHGSDYSQVLIPIPSFLFLSWNKSSPRTWSISIQGLILTMLIFSSWSRYWFLILTLPSNRLTQEQLVTLW